MTTTNFRLAPDDVGQIDTLESLVLLDDGHSLVGGGMTCVQDPTFGTGGVVPLELKAPSAHTRLATINASAILVELDSGTPADISYVSSTGEYAITLVRLAPDGGFRRRQPPLGGTRAHGPIRTPIERCRR